MVRLCLFMLCFSLLFVVESMDGLFPAALRRGVEMIQDFASVCSRIRLPS